MTVVPPPNVNKMKDQKDVDGLISAIKDDDTTISYGRRSEAKTSQGTEDVV